MSKKLMAFRLNEETVKLLMKLCKNHNRSQANMIEVLINEAAKRDKLKT